MHCTMAAPATRLADPANLLAATNAGFARWTTDHTDRDIHFGVSRPPIKVDALALAFAAAADSEALRVLCARALSEDSKPVARAPQATHGMLQTEDPPPPSVHALDAALRHGEGGEARCRDFLTRVRLGVLSDEDMKFLHARIRTEAASPDDVTSTFHYALFAGEAKGECCTKTNTL